MWSRGYNALPADQIHSLTEVLDVLRRERAATRPDIVRRTRLGRAAVNQRLLELTRAGLVVDGTVMPSTGGRGAREVVLAPEAGLVLVGHVAATSTRVGLVNLLGDSLHETEIDNDVSEGPDACLTRMEETFDDLIATYAADHDRAPAIWGVGIGLPGPVEFTTGSPVAPPIMPGWDGYPVRERLTQRFDAPTWVDNEVNLMALGELRAGEARSEEDVIYLKVGTGIGAGLISNGRLHRGALGCAGDVGHVAVAGGADVLCRCGNRGCLEAVAGGAAIARDGYQAAVDHRSPFLAQRLADGAAITAREVSKAAAAGDEASRNLLVAAGTAIGETLATLVNFFNPSLILVGGGVPRSGDILLASIRESTYRRSLPLATRDLRLEASKQGHHVGLLGAAYLVLDELFSPELLPLWLYTYSPSVLQTHLASRT